MSKPTGPTNPIMKNLIEEMRSMGYKQKIPFLIKMAEELETSKRQRAEVDLSDLNRICKENETVAVPGKVLASGIIKKPLTVAAFSFSMQAIEKIHKAKGEAITLKELIEKNPKGTDVRIVI